MMWKKICDINQLSPYQGVGSVFDDHQVALFLVPDEAFVGSSKPDNSPRVFAVGNWDPIARAYVMSRGIVGNQGEELCVASPMYKQHFSLETGACLEMPEQSLRTWQVQIKNDEVWIKSKQP
ncbi:nitrite reductase small subunit NirD [Vibrio penaeicida]|uniref:Nitrite reductase small subunit n=2 Tax=Vibrio penaeicida TaxID=104609 RepID=A0AAV5P2P9_9VIBR|nr:nitrite reductase small subunit NirD [Vibrio penaeicida]GLQ76096.1 nitrite reductase small subunit [Vibrio penaeicida]